MILHQSWIHLNCELEKFWLYLLSGVLLLDQILGDDIIDQVVNFMTEGWILDFSFNID